MKKDLSNIIKPTLDSHYVNTDMFSDIPVYHDKINDEVKPQPAPNCFLGAYYRKVFSAKDNWLGIEGVIKLGEFKPDDKRFGYDNRVDYKRYLDNPSIYMGGHATAESDAGLGWNTGYLTGDTSEAINYGTPRVAYRPFWRYIYSQVTDVEGNVERHNINSWNITDAKRFEYYYLPGDVIKMTVYSPLDHYLQLKIEVIETTTIEKYVNQRKAYQLKDDKPSHFYSPLFRSEGHGVTQAEFKRVNSMDQYGNEGFIVKHTDAKVSEATWQEVYLLRKIEGKLVKVPFDKSRQSSMICPNVASFTVDSNSKLEVLGGETITIHPTYKVKE